MEHSIYDQTDFSGIIDRINKLTPTSTPEWGKMSVGQMLAHSNLVLEQALGKMKSGRKANPIIAFLFKPILLSKKPYSKNSPTGPEFRMTEPKDFEHEKQKIVANLNEVFKRGANSSLLPHPLIGKLTSDQWGWLIWKHTDHHLRQFGV